MNSFLNRRPVRKVLALVFVALLLLPGYIAFRAIVETEPPFALVWLTALVAVYLLAYWGWWRWVGRRIARGEDWAPWSEKTNR
jgi:hypothetical protein